MEAVREALLEPLQASMEWDQETYSRLLELLLRPPRRRRMTYQEFLDWANEDTLAEWVKGEVVMASPASRQHQEIVVFLTQLLGLYAAKRELGTVLAAPFQMKLPEVGREPDVFFVAREHLDRFSENYLDGPADLAVEIISPESIGRDRGEKFAEYEAGGVSEFWLIDPMREEAEFYQLDARGRYRQVAPTATGVYQSRALAGFWLRIEWFWQAPAVWDALQELGLI